MSKRRMLTAWTALLALSASLNLFAEEQETWECAESSAQGQSARTLTIAQVAFLKSIVEPRHRMLAPCALANQAHQDLFAQELKKGGENRSALWARIHVVIWGKHQSPCGGKWPQLRRRLRASLLKDEPPLPIKEIRSFCGKEAPDLERWYGISSAINALQRGHSGSAKEIESYGKLFDALAQEFRAEEIVKDEDKLRKIKENYLSRVVTLTRQEILASTAETVQGLTEFENARRGARGRFPKETLDRWREFSEGVESFLSRAEAQNSGTAGLRARFDALARVFDAAVYLNELAPDNEKKSTMNKMFFSADGTLTDEGLAVAKMSAQARRLRANAAKFHFEIMSAETETTRLLYGMNSSEMMSSGLEGSSKMYLDLLTETMSLDQIAWTENKREKARKEGLLTKEVPMRHLLDPEKLPQDVPPYLAKMAPAYVAYIVKLTEEHVFPTFQDRLHKAYRIEERRIFSGKKLRADPPRGEAAMALRREIANQIYALEQPALFAQIELAKRQSMDAAGGRLEGVAKQTAWLLIPGAGLLVGDYWAALDFFPIGKVLTVMRGSATSAYRSIRMAASSIAGAGGGPITRWQKLLLGDRAAFGRHLEEMEQLGEKGLTKADPKELKDLTPLKRDSWISGDGDILIGKVEGDEVFVKTGMHDIDILREAQMYQALTDLGATTIYRGITRLPPPNSKLALVIRKADGVRIRCDGEECLLDEFIPKERVNIGPHTREQMLRIGEALEAAGIRSHDLEFLITPNGDPILVNPGSFFHTISKPDPRRTHWAAADGAPSWILRKGNPLDEAKDLADALENSFQLKPRNAANPDLAPLSNTIPESPASPLRKQYENGEINAETFREKSISNLRELQSELHKLIKEKPIDPTAIERQSLEHTRLTKELLEVDGIRAYPYFRKPTEGSPGAWVLFLDPGTSNNRLNKILRGARKSLSGRLGAEPIVIMDPITNAGGYWQSWHNVIALNMENLFEIASSRLGHALLHEIHHAKITSDLRNGISNPYHVQFHIDDFRPTNSRRGTSIPLAPGYPAFMSIEEVLTYARDRASQHSWYKKLSKERKSLRPGSKRHKEITDEMNHMADDYSKWGNYANTIVSNGRSYAQILQKRIQLGDFHPKWQTDPAFGRVFTDIQIPIGEHNVRARIWIAESKGITDPKNTLLLTKQIDSTVRATLHNEKIMKILPSTLKP